MTVPRQVLPRATYLVTRRCAQRQFLLGSLRIVEAFDRDFPALPRRRTSFSPGLLSVGALGL